MARITFHGAAQEVTGSCHLVESPSLGRVLLDCGLLQGGNAHDHLHRQEFAFSPASINAVILSHAHLDHSGMLPKLVHQGFNGPIYCTKATADLLEIMLKDSAGLYMRDFERENMHRKRAGKRLLKPEFTLNDVKRVLSLCETAGYEKTIAISKKAHLTFHDAGHILGASIVELIIEEKGISKTLVFSGDLGNKNSALMNDPTVLTHADILLVESTYGDRDHRCLDDTLVEFEEILHNTWKKGGNVMIPSFAVERTQEIIFHLGRLYHQGKLDNWEIFLDSPMAIAVTRLYDHWMKLLDSDDTKTMDINDRRALEDFLPMLKLSETTEQSIAINRIKKGAIIIAGSGMCTGGRIRQHFKHRIWNRNNTIIFVGYQAVGTLGRVLVDGKKNIKMFGEDFIVKADIQTLGCFSAHAGQTELIDWICNFKPNPRVMLVHGESRAQDVLSEKLWEEHGIGSDIPHKGSTIAF